MARYLLLFALLIASVRGLMFLYVHIMANDIMDFDVKYEPMNHRISRENKRVSVGSARQKTMANISTQKTAQPPVSIKNNSYSSYRNSVSR